MNEFIVNGFKFRIKKMNAIEILALKTSITFKDVNSTTETINSLLERIEVNIKEDKWLQVKQDNDFYPAGLENDLDMIDELVATMLQYLKSVFTKSNASKQ